MRTLTSVEKGLGEDGTKVRALSSPTALNLTNLEYEVPSADYCVSAFRTLRNRLTSPFRLSVQGQVADVQDMEPSQNNHAKRVFDIVDNVGMYFTCCAMHHSAVSPALVNFQYVVLYFGLGRSPIGHSKGMLYLLKDAYILDLGKNDYLRTPKTEQLCIQ